MAGFQNLQAGLSRSSLDNAPAKTRSSDRGLIVAIIVGAFIIAIGLAIGLGIGLREDDCDDVPSPTPSGLSSTGVYRYASVVADSKICSDIGADVLARMQGNAVDATVASLLCTGVVNAHSAGIGGGSFFIYYDKASGQTYSVISREAAPGAASEDMFAGDTSVPPKSQYGGLAIGVPGEVLGLYELHTRFGRVPWKSLVLPTVKLCQEGVPLTKAVHKAVEMRLTSLPTAYRDAFSMYLDSNNNPKPVGSLIQLPKLAATFQTIADDPMSFYNGSLAKAIAQDVKDAGGIMEEPDLSSYTLDWSNATVLNLSGNLKMYSTPPPGSGPVLSLILNILTGYGMSPSSVADDSSTILTTHRIVEAMKFSFGKRTELGDSAFVDMSQHLKNMSSLEFGEYFRALIDDARTHSTDYYNPTFSGTQDSGTSHLSVLDAEGNAVSVTSTINTYFGSKVKGSRTGIVFNNEMDDFSTFNQTNYFGLPSSPANYIQPGKRPLSSMCPAVVVDAKGNVVMVTGAAGGTKITSATALNVIDVLWFDQSLQHSVDKQRFHHQLIPADLQLESDFPQFVKDGLAEKAHTFRPMAGYAVVQAIHVTEDGLIHGVADYRKGGEPAGL